MCHVVMRLEGIKQLVVGLRRGSLVLQHSYLVLCVGF